MSYSDESYDLRIELDTKGCELSAGEIAEMEDGLHTLRQLVQSFPVANLYITVVHHAKRDDYHVKTSLRLSGKTLFTGERDTAVHPAFEQCIRKLVKKVGAYKQRMQGDAELAKQTSGTHHRMKATQEFDMAAIQAAVAKDDYPEFRNAVDVFESGLTERIGRWVQRYPEIESLLGNSITISDVVEDVFLHAFEAYPKKSVEIPLTDWLESLIDPTVQAVIHTPEEEFANISYARAISG